MRAAQVLTSGEIGLSLGSLGGRPLAPLDDGVVSPRRN